MKNNKSLMKLLVLGILLGGVYGSGSGGVPAFDPTLLSLTGSGGATGPGGGTPLPVPAATPPAPSGGGRVPNFQEKLALKKGTIRKSIDYTQKNTGELYCFSPVY